MYMEHYTVVHLDLYSRKMAHPVHTLYRKDPNMPQVLLYVQCISCQAPFRTKNIYVHI